MAILNIQIKLDGAQFRDEAGRVTGSVDQLEGKVTTSLDSITAKAAGFSFAFNQIGTFIAGIADQLTQPLIKFAQFETSLANVGSLGVENISGIRSEILDLSSQVAIPISNLTNGFYEIVSAGVDANAQIDVLNLTAKAAKSGLAEVTDALNLSSAFVKGYGESWAATESILDDAFMTVKVGQTTFQALSSAVQEDIPLFSALKLSSDALFGSFATLTGVTGNTAAVATQLKAVAEGLANPTAELTALVQKHGFATVEDAAAQLDLIGLIKILKEETGGSATKIRELFGSTEALTALLALTGAQYESVIANTEQMKNSTGAMTQAFNVQSDTIESRWLILQNKVNARLFETVETFRPLINQVIDFASSLIEVNWTPFVVGATAAGVALLGLNLSSVIAAIAGIGPALVSATAAIVTFGGAVSLATGGITLLVGGLATLATWLLTSKKDESELATERKRTAEETIKIINAEKARVEQAAATNGATVETTNKLRLLNEELIRQQKIISDADLKIFTKQLQEAKSDLDDLQEGLIDRFDLTGILLREVSAKTGGDLLKMEEFVSKRLAEIGDFQFKNRIGLIKLSEQEIATLEDEHESYTEIIEPLQRAAAAQKSLNTEIENRNRLLQPGGNQPVAGQVRTLAASIPPNTGREIQESLGSAGIIEMPIHANFAPADPRLISDLKVFSLDAQQEILQATFDKEDELLRLQLDNKLITEQDYFTQRMLLLNDFQSRQNEMFGAESAEALRVSLEKIRFEENYVNKRRQLTEQSAHNFLATTGALMGAFQGTNEGLFAVGKGFAYAQAVVDTYAAANKALAAYPPPFSYIAAAATIASGFANAAKIAGTKFERRAAGGFLGDDQRTLAVGDFGLGENRLIIANNREFIVNAEATARNRDLLELINRSNARVAVGSANAFQEGGVVGGGAPVIVNNDLHEIAAAIREMKIEINGVMEGQRFLRKELPVYERQENIRRV